MLYDYHYDIAAFVISVVLLVIFHLRRNFKTKSYRIFIVLIAFNMLASLFDAISCFTISYPDSYPLWFNYLVSLGYLFCYNEMSVLFFLYIDSKAKIRRLRTAVTLISVLTTGFYFVVIASSIWTHWVAYFDENKTYQHGPLFTILFTFPFIMFVLEAAIFIAARKKFNNYQVYASVSLIVGMSLSIVVTMIFPRMLIGQMTMACIIFFVYVAYENPAYYTFKETQLYNRKAFINCLYDNKNSGKKYGLIGFAIQDYEYIRNNRGEKIMEAIVSQIGDFLYRNYKGDAFSLADDKYVVLYTTENAYLSIRQQLREFFVFPFPVEDDNIKLTIDMIDIPDMALPYSVGDMESLIEYRLAHPDEQEDIRKVVENIIVAQQHRDQLIQVLKRAIENEEFEIYYQPIHDTESGKFKSAEALLRLKDEKLGFINPEELIRLAEETGYIDRVGEIVFRKVCAFMRRNKLKEKGVSYIEINLSPRQCLQPNLVPTFQSIMQVYKIEPSSINLEITETAEVAESQQWLDSVQRLHAIGVEFSIDDYGSGFASADYLIKVPVSIVKIDKMILWQAMKDMKAMVVLKNTIRMLKELGKEIVVEGVEDEEMVKLLKENHVDFLQGYYYSRPLPEAEYLEFVQIHNQ